MKREEEKRRACSLFASQVCEEEQEPSGCLAQRSHCMSSLRYIRGGLLGTGTFDEMPGPGVLVGRNQYQQISALSYNGHTVTRCESSGERTILYSFIQ